MSVNFLIHTKNRHRKREIVENLKNGENKSENVNITP